MQRIENPENILLRELPETVTVNRADFPVRTDFRTWIAFFTMHEDEKLSSEEKVRRSMSLYKDEVPADPAAAYRALQQFAACDRMPRNAGTGGKTGAGKAPVFSYLYDSTYIFSDFRRYYGIDLHAAEMHWYTFIALFDGLPQDAETKQRIAYRCVNPSEVKNKERRMQIIRIQDSIRIPHENITAGEIADLFW